MNDKGDSSTLPIYDQQPPPPCRTHTPVHTHAPVQGLSGREHYDSILHGGKKKESLSDEC